MSLLSLYILSPFDTLSHSQPYKISFTLVLLGVGAGPRAASALWKHRHLLVRVLGYKNITTAGERLSMYSLYQYYQQSRDPPVTDQMKYQRVLKKITVKMNTVSYLQLFYFVLKYTIHNMYRPPAGNVAVAIFYVQFLYQLTSPNQNETKIKPYSYIGAAAALAARAGIRFTYLYIFFVFLHIFFFLLQKNLLTLVISKFLMNDISQYCFIPRRVMYCLGYSDGSCA